MSLVEFTTDTGQIVTVAVTSAPDLVTRGGWSREDQLDRAGQTLETALSTVRSVAAAALEQLAALPRKPDEAKISFGVELTAKAGAILAMAGSSAHLQVEITWKAGETSS